MCIETEESADGNGCPSPDDSPLMYTNMGGECRYESMKFTLSNEGVLQHHCSKKRVCPKGGGAAEGTPLVVSSRCTKEQAKFIRVRTGVKKAGKCTDAGKDKGVLVYLWVLRWPSGLTNAAWVRFPA